MRASAAMEGKVGFYGLSLTGRGRRRSKCGKGDSDLVTNSPINACSGSGICTRKRRKDGHTSDIPKRQGSGAENVRTIDDTHLI